MRLGGLVASLVASGWLVSCAVNPPSTCAKGADIHIKVYVVEPDKIEKLTQSQDTVKGVHWKGLDGTHHIAVPPVKGVNDKEALRIWGHELAHAVCGKWHSTGEGDVRE